MRRVRVTKSEFLTKEEFIKKTASGNWLYQKYFYNDDDIEVSFYEEIITENEVRELLSEDGWEEVR